MSDADVLSRPVVGVSALEALAHEYRGLGGIRIAVLIRARPGAVYFQVFGAAGGELKPEAEAELTPVAEVIARIADDSAMPLLLCGDGLVRSGRIGICRRRAV